MFYLPIIIGSPSIYFILELFPFPSLFYLIIVSFRLYDFLFGVCIMGAKWRTLRYHMAMVYLRGASRGLGSYEVERP